MKTGGYKLPLCLVLCAATLVASLPVGHMCPTYVLVVTGTGEVIADDCSDLRDLQALARSSDGEFSVRSEPRGLRRGSSLSSTSVKPGQRLLEYTAENRTSVPLALAPTVQDRPRIPLHSFQPAYLGPARGS